jgi:hypothetical protein
VTDTISTTELAAATGRPPRWLQRRALLGQLPHVRAFGGRIRWRLSDVLGALAVAQGDPFARVPLPDRISSVYVAGPSAAAATCRRVMRLIEAMGIEVTLDWTEILERTDEAISPLCLAAIARADMMVIFNVAWAPTQGTWTELGAALAWRKPVILASSAECRFGALCHVMPERAALRALRARSR